MYEVDSVVAVGGVGLGTWICFGAIHVSFSRALD